MSGLFDVLAHPDLVKHWGRTRPFPEDDLRHLKATPVGDTVMLSAEVTAVDSASQTERARISVGGRPTALALSPSTNRVLVLDASTKRLTEIDTATDSVVSFSTLAVSGTLTSIQVDPSGIVESFQMNDRCAAGCGRYLGYIADEMNMGLHELGPMAMKSTKTIRINSTCTVFAGAELRDRLSLGDKREDIMAGLHRAIILRAMSILARSGGVRDQFTFTGGVAKNEAAVKALKDLVHENYGALTLNIDPDSIYTGALGGATFAWRAVVEDGKSIEART